MASFHRFTLAAVLFLAEFARGAFFLTFLPLYTTEFLGWSLATAGVAVSVHYLAETAVKSPAGWLLDRLGGPVLKGGLLLGVVSLSVVRLYPHPALLIVASGLFGLGYSPLWIGIITGVASAGAKNRSSRIGLVFTSWLAGMGAGLVAVSFFISSGFETAFNVIIAFLLAAMIMAWLFYPGAQAVRAGEVVSPKEFLLAIRGLAVNKSTRVLLPGMFLQTLSASLLLPVLPVFATSRLGLSHDGYGFLIMAGGAAAAIFLIPMGTLADRIGIRAILFTGLGFSAAALGGLALAGNPHNAVLITLVLGISYAAVLPAWNTLLARSIPPGGQATRWGVFSTIEGLGISAGPAMGGFLARYSSPSSVLLASAGILSAMALFYLFYPVEKMFKNRD